MRIFAAYRLSTLTIIASLFSTLHAAALTNVNSSFTVSMTITDQCIVNSATNLSFGTSQGVITAAVDSTSTITVQCTTGTPYTIALTVPVGETAAARVMTGTNNAAHTLTYALFQDLNHANVWGQSVGNTQGGTGNGQQQPYTVFGHVPVQTTPAADAYSETVQLVVSY